MPPPLFIAKQLARPSGFIGGLIAAFMNRGNASMNAFAVEQLQLTSGDRVLEVGFGGGVTLPALMRTAAFVAGVDPSKDMVARATRRYADAVKAGRGEFRLGNIEALPFGGGSFTKVCTVNTIYFWTSLDAGAAELHRVLTPGGRVALGFLPKTHMDHMHMPKDIFTPRAPEDAVAALATAGFTEAHVQRPDPLTAWNVIVATRGT